MKVLSPLLILVVSLSFSACSKQAVKEKTDPQTVEIDFENTNDANSQGINNGQGAEGFALDNRNNSTAIMPTQMIVYFNYDSSQLRDEDSLTIDAHAQYLLDNPSARVRLEGHADERGSREYNLALGEQRAQAIQRYLSILGVSDDQLTTLSYGEEASFNPSHNEAAWQQNRRVELVYLAKGMRR